MSDIDNALDGRFQINLFNTSGGIYQQGSHYGPDWKVLDQLNKQWKNEKKNDNQLRFLCLNDYKDSYENLSAVMPSNLSSEDKLDTAYEDLHYNGTKQLGKNEQKYIFLKKMFKPSSQHAFESQFKQLFPKHNDEIKVIVIQNASNGNIILCATLVIEVIDFEFEDPDQAQSVIVTKKIGQIEDLLINKNSLSTTEK